MGDDSKVRHVKTVCSGRELMYRIDQEYGDSYTVNESHILSLKLKVAPVIYDDKLKKCFYVEWYSKSDFHSGTISCYPILSLLSRRNFQTFLIYAFQTSIFQTFKLSKFEDT